MSLHKLETPLVCDILLPVARICLAIKQRCHRYVLERKSKLWQKMCDLQMSFAQMSASPSSPIKTRKGWQCGTRSRTCLLARCSLFCSSCLPLPSPGTQLLGLFPFFIDFLKLLAPNILSSSKTFPGSHLSVSFQRRVAKVGVPATGTMSATMNLTTR